MVYRNQDIIFSDGWKWSRFEACDKFRVGEDKQGKKWLLKNRGSFYALREMVFSLIAERLKINVQLSKYLNVSENVNNLNMCSRYQLAIEYIEECSKENISKFSSYIKAYETRNDKLVSLLNCGHQDALDIVKVDILSYIFGANETSEILLSGKGRIYIVDNEQMFSTNPVDLLTCEWFSDNHTIAMSIAYKMCVLLADISNNDIDIFTSVPDGYKVDENWPIQPLVLNARDYARRFVKTHA